MSENRIVFEGISATPNQQDNLTCMQFSQEAVIDAGYLPRPRNNVFIKHIFLSHTHLDHIKSLAFYVDTYFMDLDESITIYASKKSIKNLKNHFFNDVIWPDFSQILLPCKKPAIRYKEIKDGENLIIDEVKITAVSSLHCDGSFSFILENEGFGIYFTSDTYYDENIAKILQTRTNIKQIILDVSFESRYETLAKDAAHLTPKLASKLKQLCPSDVIFHVFHIKSSHYENILKELAEYEILGEFGSIIRNGSFVYFDPARQDSRLSKHYNLNQEQKLQAILQCFSQISKSSDSKINLRVLGEMVKQNIQADRCSVWFIDNEKKEYYTYHADGVSQIRVPFGKGLVGETIRTKEAILENNPASNAHFDPSNDIRTNYKTRSVLTMPIINSDNEVIGVFQALNKLTTINNSFDLDDLDYLRIAADYSGRIYEGLKFQEDLLSVQKDLIYSIAEMVESKSEETGNHVKRVGKISEVIARQMKLSDEDISLISYGAPTHDIGKIGISDAILNKPGKLSEEEFKTMQRHSKIGYEMLRRFKGKIMEAAAIIAYEHHEKYGGGGYPMGKKGEDIHIYARIVSLADVFDALASERCYKKAWPIEEVCEYIKKMSGTQFDPKVVDAFFECLPEIIQIKDTYADSF